MRLFWWVRLEFGFEKSLRDMLVGVVPNKMSFGIVESIDEYCGEYYDPTVSIVERKILKERFQVL